MKLKLKTNIDELQQECQVRGLPTTGGVKELKERVRKFDAEPKSDLFRAPEIEPVKTNLTFALAENRFLIQLKLANLSMYFVHGYFYPLDLEESTVYKEQNRKADLFTLFPDHLPLCKGVINDFDESQVLVEVILADEEIQKLQTAEKINFLDSPIPVSRVSAIYFANQSAKTSFLASVEVFPDAYVPKGICQIIPEQIGTEKLPAAPVLVKSLAPWKDIIKTYDRLLGLIAFLKNTALFYTNATNEYIEYTPGYFQVLSLFNNQEESTQKENSFFRWIISPESIEIDAKLARFQFKEIIKAVYDNRDFDIDWGLQLLENSMAFEKSVEAVEQLRTIAKLFFDYKKMRIDYRAILAHPLVQKNIPVIILVFLIKFPNRGLGHSDKQAFKNYFRTNESAIERSHAEYIFAVLGLYYGYSNLVKEDRFEFVDTYFASLARENGQIKFKLDSFLDRFVIESVFEYVKRNGERLKTPFHFLNVNATPLPAKLQLPRSADAEYIDQSFHKYGKQILSIRKVGANIIIAKELPVLYGEQITQADHLFTYIARHYPELLAVKTEKLAQLIAENPGNRTLAELRDTIELDKKYGRSKWKR